MATGRSFGQPDPLRDFELIKGEGVLEDLNLLPDAQQNAEASVPSRRGRAGNP